MKLPQENSPIVPVLKAIRQEVKFLYKAPASSMLRKIQKELALMALYISFWEINEALQQGVTPPFSYRECYSIWKTQGSFFDSGMTNSQLLTNQCNAGARVEFFFDGA